MACLPPGVNALSSFVFGTLYLSVGKVQLYQQSAEGRKFKIQVYFYGEEQSQILFECTDVTYQIYCSLWHFHSYLMDIENIKLEIMDERKNKIGQALIYLPVFINNDLNDNSMNVMDPFQSNFTIFPVGQDIEGKPFGQIQIKLSTKFKNQYTQIAKNHIPRTNVKKQAEQSIANLKHHLENEFMMLNNNYVHNNISDHKNFLSAHTQEKDEFVFNEEQATRKLEQEIDRMVADLESKEYDSSKYQDSNLKEINYYDKQLFEKEKESTLRIQPKFMVTEYILNNNPSSKQTAERTEATSRRIQLQENIPFGYNRGNQIMQQQNNKRKQMRSQAKTLKIQIFQLSMTVTNQNVLNQFLDSKLIIQFPNSQRISFIGKKSGQAIKYNGSYQVQVQDTVDLQTQNHTYFSTTLEKQYICFTIFDRFETSELAYGKFDLQRLTNVEGKGVFMISLNNRRFQGNQKIKVPNGKLTAFKPSAASLYTLRISLQLLSDLKNKVYQILLNIEDVIIDSLEKDAGLNVKYKLYGSQQRIQITAKNMNSCNHTMIIPVLVENLLKDKQGKIIIEVWNSDTLLGITDFELNKIEKSIAIDKGKMNEKIFSANLYPVYVYKGSFAIKQLVNKRKKGDISVTLCFGNVKQINKVMQQKNKLKTEQPEKPSKKMMLPYDQKLGIFIKQKKSVKEVDIQVEQHLIHNEFNEFNEQNEFNEFIPHNNFQKQYAKYETTQKNQSFFIQQQQVQQIRKVPQPLIITPKTDPLAKITNIQNHVTLTKQYIKFIEDIIKKILMYKPDFIKELKKLVKPYMLFSFIEHHQLIQCFEKIALQAQILDDILTVLPRSNQSNMVCMTPLYDYFSSMEISGTISQNLLNEEQLADFMIEKYITKIEREDQEEGFISDIDDVKQKFRKYGYFLNLRQVEIFFKRYKKQLNIDSMKKWTQLYAKVKVYQQNKQLQDEVKEMEDNKLIDQIYNISSSVGTQQDLPRSNYLCISLKGYENCLQSAKCLLDLSFVESEIMIRFSIKSQSYEARFTEDKTVEINMAEGFNRQEFEGQSATIELYLQGSVVSKGTVNLQNLSLDEISSTYALKTKQNKFCGLVHLTVLYIQQ